MCLVLLLYVMVDCVMWVVIVSEMCCEFVIVVVNLCYNLFDDVIIVDVLVDGLGDYLFKVELVVLWLFVCVLYDGC